MMSPNVNLLIQILMGLALLVGMFLARQKKYVAHGICQTVVLVLNLVVIIFFMLPVFGKVVEPNLFTKGGQPFYFFPTLHAFFGTFAEIFGLYLILIGWKLLPESMRLKNFKRWMRFELGLWWLVIVLGLATYYVWNAADSAPTASNNQITNTQPEISKSNSNIPIQTTPQTVIVKMKNYEFSPKELKIEAGTTVIWKNESGKHTVLADDKGFESEVIASGGEFKRTFDKEGNYKYFCSLHGAMGGEGMSGTIIVTAPGQK